MSRFAVDENNELIREGGAFVRVPTSAEEIRQDIQVAGQIFEGEAPFDLSVGYPWLRRLQKGVPAEIIESSLSAYIGDRPGVTSVTSLQLTDLGDRKARIDYTVQGSVAEQEAALVSGDLTVQG